MKEGKKGKKEEEEEEEETMEFQPNIIIEKINLNKEMLEKDCRGNQIYEAL